MTSHAPVIFQFEIIPYKIFTQCFPLINQSLQDNLGSIYLESIEGGFLYICSDFDTFSHLHIPLSDETKQRITQLPIDQKLNLSAEDLLPQEKFPVDGIKMIVQPKNTLSFKAMPKIISYYSTLHPDIAVIIEQPNRMIVYFHSYDAWKFQIRLIYESLLIPR
jgi:hypothetical protein